jgi:hypothetical protein
MKRSSGERDEMPSRPVTFRAAENLGAFELAQLWADRTAWPIDLWREWALRLRDFVIADKPGMTADEYSTVVRRFAEAGCPRTSDR